MWILCSSRDATVVKKWRLNFTLFTTRLTTPILMVCLNHSSHRCTNPEPRTCAKIFGLDESELPCLLFLFFSSRSLSKGFIKWRYCSLDRLEALLYPVFRKGGDLAESHLAKKRKFKDDTMQRAQRGNKSKKRRRREEED